MFKKIVVATHGVDDGSRDALALALLLRGDSDAPLILGTVWHRSMLPTDGVYESVLRSRALQEAEELLAEVPDGARAEVRDTGARSVARGLHAIAEEEGADLLVLGPQIGEARVFRSDIALGALSHAPCAVAIAREGQRDRAGALRRILVAWEGGAEAEGALDAAVALAERTGASLHVVEVVDTAYLVEPSPLVDGPMVNRQTTALVESAQASVSRAASLVAERGGRVSVTTEVRQGLVAAELAAAAAEADLLVMGSRGYGPIRRLAVGSTSAGLVADVACPVVITPRGAVVAEHAGA